MKFIIEQIITISSTLEVEFDTEEQVDNYMETDDFYNKWYECADRKTIDESDWNIQRIINK